MATTINKAFADAFGLSREWAARFGLLARKTELAQADRRTDRHPSIL
jgi:hypothetical protein